MNRVEQSAAGSGSDLHRSRRTWALPAGLLLLAAVPAIGGVYRVAHLALGGEVTPANQRFFTAPTPILLHGVACALFAVLGAFQFTGGGSVAARRHRVRGMVFMPSALVVAASGLWMQATYELPAHDGPLLSAFRFAFGGGMLVTTALGVRALARRRFAAHGAWMMRTYAIGMGAGTQVLLFIPWVLMLGQPSVTQRAWLMGGGWAVNLTVAEWCLRRRARGRPRPTALAGGLQGS